MRLTALTLSILLGALLEVAAVSKTNSCPGAPVPLGGCDPAEVNNLCHSDIACKGREKCCPTFCGKQCTEPGPVKAGSCPVVNTFAPCKHPIPKKCNFDSQCDGKQKCCDNGCFLQCVDPWAPPKPSIKPGSCPQSPIPFAPCPTVIPQNQKECNNDQDCTGEKKCCLYACQMMCKDPTEPPKPPKPGKCPFSLTPKAPCPVGEKPKCNSDQDCTGKQKCCRDFCRMTCTEPIEPPKPPKPGTCPSSIPFFPCSKEKLEMERECWSDQGCTGKQKCCQEICRMKCKEPIGPLQFHWACSQSTSGPNPD